MIDRKVIAGVLLALLAATAWTSNCPERCADRLSDYCPRGCSAPQNEIFNCTRFCSTCRDTRPNQCPQGHVFRIDGDPCACCDACVKVQDEGQSCSPTLSVTTGSRFVDVALSNVECKEGLECVSGLCRAKQGNCGINNTLLKYSPKCDADSNYEPKQCKGNICFCVDAYTGIPVLGTTMLYEDSKYTECLCPKVRNRRGKSLSPLILQSSIVCDDIGNFREVQCSPWHCWCVHRTNGSSIPYTKVPKPLNYRDIQTCSDLTGTKKTEQRLLPKENSGTSQPINRILHVSCENDTDRYTSKYFPTATNFSGTYYTGEQNNPAMNKDIKSNKLSNGFSTELHLTPALGIGLEFFVRPNFKANLGNVLRNFSKNAENTVVTTLWTLFNVSGIHLSPSDIQKSLVPVEQTVAKWSRIANWHISRLVNTFLTSEHDLVEWYEIIKNTLAKLQTELASDLNNLSEWASTAYTKIVDSSSLRVRPLLTGGKRRYDILSKIVIRNVRDIRKLISPHVEVLNDYITLYLDQLQDSITPRFNELMNTIKLHLINMRNGSYLHIVELLRLVEMAAVESRKFVIPQMKYLAQTARTGFTKVVLNINHNIVNNTQVLKSLRDFRKFTDRYLMKSIKANLAKMNMSIIPFQKLANSMKSNLQEINHYTNSLIHKIEKNPVVDHLRHVLDSTFVKLLNSTTMLANLGNIYNTEFNKLTTLAKEQVEELLNNIKMTVERIQMYMYSTMMKVTNYTVLFNSLASWPNIRMHNFSDTVRLQFSMLKISVQDKMEDISRALQQYTKLINSSMVVIQERIVSIINMLKVSGMSKQIQALHSYLNSTIGAQVKHVLATLSNSTNLMKKYLNYYATQLKDQLKPITIQLKQLENYVWKYYEDTRHVITLVLPMLSNWPNTTLYKLLNFTEASTKELSKAFHYIRNNYPKHLRQLRDGIINLPEYTVKFLMPAIRNLGYWSVAKYIKAKKCMYDFLHISYDCMQRLAVISSLFLERMSELIRSLDASLVRYYMTNCADQSCILKALITTWGPLITQVLYLLAKAMVTAS